MIEFDGGSFKDPSGRVFHHDGAVYRTLSTTAHQHFTAARDRGLTQELVHERLLVPSELVRAEDAGLRPTDVGAWLLRHPRIPFVSYSYEWGFEMLRDAALVTLRILTRALGRGFILKDANAFNILFDGCLPTHVDPPSLEPYNEGDVWAGYGQFCRSFLFPLLVAAYRDIDPRPLLRGTLGELSIQDAARLLRPLDVLRPGVLVNVILQRRLEHGFAHAGHAVSAVVRPVRLPKAALLANIRRLSVLVEGLRGPQSSTEWSGYEARHSYSEGDQGTKTAFVAGVVNGSDAARIVDLGSNTGTYARAAVEHGRHAIALDIDVRSIDRLYRRMSGDRRLSPIVGDLLNPTPAMGWALTERRPLLPRLRSDCFLALALIHHLRIAGGVPLALILDQLLAIAPQGVVEWVDKRDAMVQQMLSLRKDVYDDYSRESFEALLHQRCRIVSTQTTHGGHRTLYHVTSPQAPAVS